MIRISLITLLTVSILSCQQESKEVNFDRFGISVQLYEDWVVDNDDSLTDNNYYLYLKNETDSNRSSFHFLIKNDTINLENQLEDLVSTLKRTYEEESTKYEYSNDIETPVLANSINNRKYKLEIKDGLNVTGSINQVIVNNKLVFFMQEFSEGIADEHTNCLKLIEATLAASKKDDE